MCGLESVDFLFNNKKKKKNEINHDENQTKPKLYE
jgi:hypothetical protein